MHGDALFAMELKEALQDTIPGRISRDPSLIDQFSSKAASDSLDSIANLPYTPSKFPTFRPQDRQGDPFNYWQTPNPLILSTPEDIRMQMEIDTAFNYTVYEELDEGIDYRPPMKISFEEYSKLQEDKARREYWRSKSQELDGEGAMGSRDLIPPIYISPVFDRIFGGTYVDIKPNGFINLDFGGRWQRVDNPAIPIRQQRNGGFEFQQQINMNVVGQVGDKLQVLANFDNNTTFDFENQFKVEYTGYEEDIIKKIELGNVSLPLNNSLITGAQNLFGAKTQLQFGRLFVTGIASIQRGVQESITFEGGAQGREFEIIGSDYDERKHFFLGHFFRENYENWLNAYPQILSGVNITRVEVYVMNRNNNTQTQRNFVATQDLGEGRRIHNPTNPNIGTGRGNVPTHNAANDLFANLRADPSLRAADQAGRTLESGFGLRRSVDFEQINGARKLEATEFKVHRQLGYISLLRKLQNDEVLAVSYEYTFNGEVFKVGEMVEDYQNRPEDEVIFMKMLRPSRIDVRIPTWDLMMKNVYSLNINQLNREGFELRVIYRDDRTGLDNPSLHEGASLRDIPLIEILQLDRLNQNNDPQPDGNFDFVEGVTVNSDYGLIVFPVLEPLGRTLRDRFQPGEENLIQRYVFDTLYRGTKADAELVTRLNKFFLRGRYQAGSAASFQLPGFNIAEGSVRVTVGGSPLAEGSDYTVDYNLGRVNILNQSMLNSGKPITVSFEKADMFQFQTRTLLGTRMDYVVNEDFNIGATMLYFNERPLISRVNVGEETMRNLKWGVDLSYRTESRFLTKMVDALPLVQTKEMSTLTFQGEFAQLRPGTSNIVAGEGSSYIDDFENSATPFNLGGNFQSWKLGATPATPSDLFDKRNQVGEELGYNYKRAKLSWYIVDNIFYRRSGGGANARPPNIRDEDLENHYVRPIDPQEVFPARDREVVNPNLPIFDLAYYPRERGMYNFNPDLDTDGRLRNPEENFGAITRAITSDVDFDQTNIEFIEFWVMDPFIQTERGRVLDGIENTNNSTGGKVVFNLGSISEDLIPDGRHGFENGLPADGGTGGTLETPWGRVTTQQFLTDAFDNDPQARQNQDVGFDGLSSEEERTFFSEAFLNRLSSISPDARQRIEADPAADDFRFYLGPDLDDQDIKILERYKFFNGVEGNSPANAGQANFTAANTNLPDNEDLNNDNTISELEEYFEYEIDLRPQSLNLNNKYIIDQVVNNVNGDDVNWYLVRIPIRNPDRTFGDINDFKSIRFMRLYLKEFRQPVVLRMAQFRMVGSQWRRFEENLFDKGLNEIPEPYDAGFRVDMVNIEENGTAGPNKTPYVLPPGIERDRDNASTIVRELNEQSIRLCVDNLRDNDARAIFKNQTLDLVNYGRIKMFFHAESDDAVDGEMTAFLRLGTDFTDNYYEIEVPLELTVPGTRDPRQIWPEANEIDFDLEELFTIKALRNRLNINQEIPFTNQVGQYNVTIRGRPEISRVQTIMIGVRNPRSELGTGPRQLCIWANELRLTDFNTVAGWAANGRVNARLADFADITANLRYSTFGFGMVQSRISERTREDLLDIDLSANVNLDKFTPESFGLKVPMFVSYETSTLTPFFDPLDPDTPLEASLQSIRDPVERDLYRSLVIDRTVRRGINFSNVRKMRTNDERTPTPFDISNFAFTYAFSEMNRSAVNIETFQMLNYRGGIAYNFVPEPVVFEPFTNWENLNSPYLRLFKEFNLNLLPGNIAVRGDLDRRFVKTQFRNAQLNTRGILPQFEKFFNFNRDYSMRWDLTRSLAIDYRARANTIIDEPEGIINREARDSIRTNLRSFGRMRQFDQSINANYRLPLDYLPLTDWIQAEARYGVNFTWMAGAVGQADSLGNTIQNNREQAITGKIDMVKLYNKWGVLKDINSPKRGSRRPPPPGRRPPGRGGSDKEEEDEKKSQIFENKNVKKVLRGLMAFRNVNFNYSINEGTMLPGYMPGVFMFGMDEDFAGPGWDFLLGSQSLRIQERAVREGWMAPSSFLTQPFMQSQQVNMDLRALIEPLPDFRVQIDFRKMQMSGYQEIFRFDTLRQDFVSLTPNRSGSYSISFNAMSTFFVPSGPDNTSPTFESFEDYRSIIRERLLAINSGDGTYNLNSQDVLIPAFIAAYTGQDPRDSELNPFPRMPMPNWRVDYAGLAKNESLGKIFQSINISHGYSSSYDVMGFSNSLAYTDRISLDNDLRDFNLGNAVNEDGEFIPTYIIDQVMISERFSPLIGVDVRTKSRITAKAEYRMERNLALQMSNSQIAEMTSNDLVLGFGVTRPEFKFPFRWAGRTIRLKNEITFRVDFSIRDTQTIQRRIDEVSTVTAGNINYQLRPNVQYMASQRLQVMLYFERAINEPRISSSFPRNTTAIGTQIRFNLAD